MCCKTSIPLTLSTFLSNFLHSPFSDNIPPLSHNLPHSFSFFPFLPPQCFHPSRSTNFSLFFSLPLYYSKFHFSLPSHTSPSLIPSHFHLVFSLSLVGMHNVDHSLHLRLVGAVSLSRMVPDTVSPSTCKGWSCGCVTGVRAFLQSWTVRIFYDSIFSSNCSGAKFWCFIFLAMFLKIITSWLVFAFGLLVLISNDCKYLTNEFSFISVILMLFLHLPT